MFKLCFWGRRAFLILPAVNIERVRRSDLFTSFSSSLSAFLLLLSFLLFMFVSCVFVSLVWSLV